MEIKKTEKASLENKKLIFLEIGLILALAVVYVAFEWKTEEQQIVELEDTTQVIEVEEVIATQTETPPPPPSAPKMPVLSDQIDIVDDEIVVDDNMFLNLEDDANMGVEIMDYVENVEEEVIAKELAECIRRFVRGLPAREGDVFSRRYFFTEGIPDIARAYGLTPNNTMVILSRVRQKLKAHLVKEGYLHEDRGSV